MRALLFAALALALAACETVRNPDARPGENVVVERPPFPLTALLDLRQANLSSYQRIMVIAPPGARSCNAGFFAGPERGGAPNADGAVVLDVPTGRDQVRVRCNTEQGPVEREVPAVVVHRQPLRHGPRPEMVIRRYPPIIHVGVPDGEAGARWQRLHGALCAPEVQPADAWVICNDDAFAALRRADIGE